MNKESYSYYKIAYKANKKYRDSIGSKEYGPLLTKSEFEDFKIGSGLSTKDIVYNQFHYYTRAAVKQIKAAMNKEFKDTNYKPLTTKAIQTKNYSPEIARELYNKYYRLKAEGLTAADAGQLISHTYYGS